MIDDSFLLHYSKGYDPAKARAYYLRTRKLKGRRQGLSQLTEEQIAAQVKARKERKQAAKEAFEKAATGNEGKYDRYRPPTPEQRREQLKKQRAELEARFKRLQDVLEKLVEAAKARSGVETKSEKQSSTKTPSKEKATSKESTKKDSPLTTAEKKEKAAKAKEEYQKENGGPSLSTEVVQLQKKIADIRKKIDAAVADARQKTSGPQNQTASNGR